MPTLGQIIREIEREAASLPTADLRSPDEPLLGNTTSPPKDR